MFFKQKHLLAEMRKSGRRATAEIISIKTVGGSKSIRALWAPDEDLSGSWVDCRMQLRVFPEQDGEPPFEATATTRLHALKYLGGTVPVWYTPGDTARVVVDYESGLAGEMHWMADAERLAHRHDQRPGLVWTPLGSDLLPLEVHAEPGPGRVTVGGPLEKFLGGHASAAVKYVRSNVFELAPDLGEGWFERHDLHVGQPYGDLPADLTPQHAASAGLAVAAALISAASGRPVRTDVAVTGALTQAGELLPVRGLREKAHCAKLGYAKFLVAPKANESDIHQVSQQDLRDLRLVFAASVAEALGTAVAKA
jgi:Lon protease (S16) C-terminal proteolytic domain